MGPTIGMTSREITTGFSRSSPARPRPGSASLTGAYAAGSVSRARGLPAVFASLLGRSSLWSLPGENFRFGLRSCKQPFPVSLAQLRSPWRVRDRANGPRARREWSGEIHARSDSYHVAWSAMAERWCRFYRSRGLNCRGGRCTRRHAALYFCTTIPKTKREPWSRGRPRRV